LLALNSKSPNPSAIPFLGILGALVGSAAFKAYGFILIKKCHISNISSEHIEVCFASEDYARSFSKLNGLEYEARR
jgi:xanthosine utilization system XapX-like protein